jgi:hypothetical protein
MPRKPLKYVAELLHVREVSLLGAADLTFWKNMLKDEDLILTEKESQAQILVIAADSKYLGMRFREVSFSVLTDGYKGIEFAGAYLLRAFNSSRFFAFCERTLFSTPYYHADVRVNCCPASVQIIQAGEVVFRAAMTADDSARSRAPTRHGKDGWEGPVFLPTGRLGGTRGDKLFFAKIKGHTQVYPFVPSEDSLLLRPSQNGDVVQALIDSRFACKEWIVREDATHAKSKTCGRIEALAELARK